MKMNYKLTFCNDQIVFKQINFYKLNFFRNLNDGEFLIVLQFYFFFTILAYDLLVA